MFFLFKTFAPLLADKEIIIETDHQSLLWMQNIQTPIVQRWRIYMQGFMHKVQLIPGKKMGMADYLSRMYSVTDEDKFSYLHTDELTHAQFLELQHDQLEDLELETNIVLEDQFLHFLLEQYHDYKDMNDDLMSPIDNPDMNSENDEMQHPQITEYYLMEIIFNLSSWRKENALGYTTYLDIIE